MGKRTGKSRKRLLIGSAIGVGALAPALFLPISRRPLVYRAPDKRLSYEEAVSELRFRASALPDGIWPECADHLLEHGRPTEQVFVFLHGLSNCPAQFGKLGRQLFERGHNVVIPRLPYHGEKNSLASDWARLTAAEMLEAGNGEVNLARSLGGKVTVAGLSANGATVAWMAQNRSDLDRAVLLAPFLAPAGLPSWALAPVERLLLRLPNMFVWWNSKLKEKLSRPYYAYPRFPTRVIGETMFLGREVLRESRVVAPRCASILVITSASDTAANHRLTRELVARWRGHEPGIVETFEFPASEEVPHDFIDPNQPNQRIAVVYPQIIELLER